MLLSSIYLAWDYLFDVHVLNVVFENPIYSHIVFVYFITIYSCKRLLCPKKYSIQEILILWNCLAYGTNSKIHTNSLKTYYLDFKVANFAAYSNIGSHIKRFIQNSLNTYLILVFSTHVQQSEITLGATKKRFSNNLNVPICQFRSAISFLGTDIPCSQTHFPYHARILFHVGGSRIYLVLNLLCTTVSDLISISHLVSTHWVFNLMSIMHAYVMWGYVFEITAHTATIKQLIIVWLIGVQL